ncbi:TonB-dependent receptor [Novosphingobium humi]|uniref:TonB-dependent receptor n=1 Tax=Novosphingobium humi TaxID=2282397 RepID=A0ABY7U1L8_9SPHN|nr:TonB-dependent receptor [Novosphingobium humi]WCT79133.1 TonB-dependent receptor [Novosphingobium humi]
MQFSSKGLWVTAATMAVAVSMPAWAQGGDASSSTAANQGQSAKADEGRSSALGGDIVVTAQRRSENIQKVGIAISAFSGAQLRALNVVDSRDIAALTPGVHLGGAIAGQNSQYTIRGVTQNDFNDVVEAPNAVYLDDGYIAIGQGQTFALFDIDRVEVLKGPQGTLFGRNATGGLVHYITKKPSLSKTTGFIDLNYGLYDSPGTPGAFHGEAALNLPMGDKVATRIAAMWNKADPLLRNLYPAGAVGGSPGPGAGANTGDDDTLGGRITTLFEPSSSASITLSLNAARSQVATAAYQQKPTIAQFNAAGEMINVLNAAPTETRASIGANGQDFGSDVGNTGQFGAPFGRPVPGGDFFGYKDPDGSGFYTSNDFAFKSLNRSHTYGANLSGEFKLGSGINLTSVTDYKNFYKLLFLDVDAGPANQAANYQGVDAWTLSQEFRLAGKARVFDWTAGLYYLHINTHSINGLKFPTGSVVPGAPFDLGADAHLITNSYSAFGQIDWHLADRLKLTTGGRLIREEKDYRYLQGIWATQDSRMAQVGAPLVIGPVVGAAGPAPYAATDGRTLWAGKVQLDFQAQDNLLLYLGVNRGVKAGSFNAQLPGGRGVPVSAIPYKPEVLLSYEGGFKYNTPDRKTRLNASAYYYDYKDYQAFLFTGVSGVVVNANARTYGFEASLFTSPLAGLDLGLSASYFDALVKNVPLRVNGPISRDVRPVYAPPFQASAIARYEWAGWGGKFFVGADAQYSSSFYYNLRNFDADKFGRYMMLNAGVGWSNDNWTFSIRARNLTDVRAGVQGFDLASLCGCNEVSYKPPRFFQIGARYNF